MRGRARAAAAGAVLLAVLLALGYALLSPGGRVLTELDSPYGRIRVVEHRDGLRTLYTGEGSGRQTALYPGRPAHLELPYTRVAMIGLALAPRDGRLLFVGLGGGAMPTYARHVLPDARIEAVDIDPLIVDVARQYFGFREDDRMIAHVGDGRAFIERAPAGTYDVVFLDAFSADGIPEALTTREFLQAVQRVLAPDGVVVSNLWSRNAAYEPMVATYQDVFGAVELLRVPARAQRILVAGDTRSLDPGTLTAAARNLGARVALGFDLETLVRTGHEAPRAVNAPVLRD